VIKIDASKIAITIDDNLLKQLDLMVKSKVNPNRGKAIQEAVADKLKRFERTLFGSFSQKAFFPFGGVIFMGATESIWYFGTHSLHL